MGLAELFKKADSNKLKLKTVKIRFTTKEMLEGTDDYDTHREFVAAQFNKAGWFVLNYRELRYFYGPDYVVVEGVSNVSLLSV